MAELGYMLGVSRARVSQLVAKPGFPAPTELRMGKVWQLSDVEAWAKERGRRLEPLPATWPTVPASGDVPANSGRYSASS